ncbi:hypothetical protein PspLS_06397 [Pyricularia sp. CBS 133598]|nr:hypothetical protein PspLS_06397 [Pyricularia sp. CBS 133598]
MTYPVKRPLSAACLTNNTESLQQKTDILICIYQASWAATILPRPASRTSWEKEPQLPLPPIWPASFPMSNGVSLSAIGGGVPSHNTSTTCDNCDKTMIIPRSVRPSNIPEFHYGPIASGDSVIELRQERDHIVRRWDNSSLAWSYGAISYYADSHKKDDWQHYAAAGAAVCAKELLLLRVARTGASTKSNFR